VKIICGTEEYGGFGKGDSPMLKLFMESRQRGSFLKSYFLIFTPECYFYIVKAFKDFIEL